MTSMTTADGISQSVDVKMVRANLEGFPVVELPAGYRMRTYRDGDRQTWTDLHLAAERFVKVTPELFDRQFGHALPALADRMFFLETLDGTPVGSITAWWGRQYEEAISEQGRIHWVVIHPAYQRRGLAKPMMTHAMRRLAQSHDSALLGTATGRPWAIKVYLDYGFRPDPAELARPEIVNGWRQVQRIIAHPALAQTAEELD